MIIDHMFHIVMDMFDIMISMVNNLLYVIIIMLICGIKMTWKLPNHLTPNTPLIRVTYVLVVLIYVYFMACLYFPVGSTNAACKCFIINHENSFILNFP
jgi:hypothetical protein